MNVPRGIGMVLKGHEKAGFNGLFSDFQELISLNLIY
jgi:hypothetical protein